MREHGEQCLEKAEKLLETSPLSEDEQKKLAGSIAAVGAHYAVINEHLTLAIEQAKKALHLIPDTDYYTQSTAWVALGAAYWGQGKILKAEEAFMECASTALQGGFVYRASSALCYAGMQQVKQAKLRAAEKTFQQALSLAQGPGEHQYPDAGYPLAKLSELALEWNHLRQARELAIEGVELCNQLGHVDLIAEANIALARVQLADNDFGGVQESLHQVEKLALQTKLDPWVLGWLAECQVRLWLAMGELEQASHWRASSGIDLDGEFSFHYDLHHINLARVLVAQIQQHPLRTAPEKCLRLLDRLLTICDEMGWIHHLIQVQILQALVLQATNNTKSALHALRSAITMAEPDGYIRIFVCEGDELEKLLSLLAKQAEPNGYVAELLRAFPADISSQQPGLVEPLSPREMEVLTFLTTSLSVSSIAGELNISVNTVRSHIKSIYGKLGVNRRLDAIAKAKELNLVP
jgi:LuxR family maltose regulon positive regulatory protein